MCVRSSSFSPREKKQMVTNNLWDGAKPELLPETKGMDAADELVFLNREIRKLRASCEQYRDKIKTYEDRYDGYRHFLYNLRTKARKMDWSPTTDEIITLIEEELFEEERNC